MTAYRGPSGPHKTWKVTGQLTSNFKPGLKHVTLSFVYKVWLRSSLSDVFHWHFTKKRLELRSKKFKKINERNRSGNEWYNFDKKFFNVGSLQTNNKTKSERCQRLYLRDVIDFRCLFAKNEQSRELNFNPSVIFFVNPNQKVWERQYA